VEISIGVDLEMRRQSGGELVRDARKKGKEWRRYAAATLVQSDPVLNTRAFPPMPRL
jgi:hypothetical protein